MLTSPWMWLILVATITLEKISAAPSDLRTRIQVIPSGRPLQEHGRVTRDTKHPGGFHDKITPPPIFQKQLHKRQLNLLKYDPFSISPAISYNTDPASAATIIPTGKFDDGIRRDGLYSGHYEHSKHEHGHHHKEHHHHKHSHHHKEHGKHSHSHHHTSENHHHHKHMHHNKHHHHHSHHHVNEHHHHHSHKEEAKHHHHHSHKEEAKHHHHHAHKEEAKNYHHHSQKEEEKHSHVEEQLHYSEGDEQFEKEYNDGYNLGATEAKGDYVYPAEASEIQDRVILLDLKREPNLQTRPIVAE